MNGKKFSIGYSICAGEKSPSLSSITPELLARGCAAPPDVKMPPSGLSGLTPLQTANRTKPVHVFKPPSLNSATIDRLNGPGNGPFKPTRKETSQSDAKKFLSMQR